MKKTINQIKLKLATLVTAIDPKSATGWKMKAENQRSLFKYDESIASYERYLSLCSCDFKTLTVVGALLNSLGRSEEAIVFFDKAIALHPGYIPAVLNKGYAYSQLAKYEDAIRCYDEVLLLNCYLAAYNQPCETTSHYQAWLNKGHSWQFLGQYEKAIACYLDAVAAKPDDCQLATASLVNCQIHANLAATKKEVLAFQRYIEAKYN